MRITGFYIMACISILILSCEPKTRYKILTTFIDGVPPYEEWLEGKKKEEKPGEKLTPEVIRKKEAPPVVYVVHKPFAEDKCTDCHDPVMGNRTVLPREELCFKCHQKMRPDPQKFAHGPVAAGMCLACHHPHRSENSKLLLVKSSEICQGCHGKMDQGKQTHPPVLEGNCGACHDLPHSLGKDFLLGRDQKELCLECHSDKVQYRYVHGVVAVGECLICHRTHKDSPSHLITTSQAMCGQCHDIGKLKKTRTHRAIGEDPCFRCHNPHGGDVQYFLKQKG